MPTSADPLSALPAKVKQSMGYQQLTQIQRYQVFAYLETGISQRKIAKAIGIHSSTSPSDKTQRADNGYAPEQAQLASNQRRRSA